MMKHNGSDATIMAKPHSIKGIAKQPNPVSIISFPVAIIHSFRKVTKFP